MANARFKVDESRCIGCGSCVAVCPGNMISQNVLKMENGHPVMIDPEKFGWEGCWRCQHCLAVCPGAAISILGIDPDEVSGKPDDSIATELPKLLKYRRSCRDFRQQEVDAQTIDMILDAVSGVPTGGNNNSLEFSVIYTREAMRRLYEALFNNVQTDLFHDDTEDFSALRIYNAPHLFVAHKKAGGRFNDGALIEMNLATAYFELMANACGLGTIITTYAAELLTKSEEALRILNIPEDHRFMSVVGFGYPVYPYARGIQKQRKTNKIR